MAWRDDYLPGSFRGVPFKTEAAGGQFGRRMIVHEYPRRDSPYAEDLGRKARQFDIEALVIGTDYMRARDRLIEALEKPGAGELVHPYRGRLQVVVVDASVSESTDEGGIARFRISFVEAGEKREPAGLILTSYRVNHAADTAKASALSGFARVFQAAGYLDFVGEAAVNQLNEALNAVQSASGLTVLSSGLFPGFVSGLTGTAARLGTLIRTPETLGASLYAQIGGLVSVAASYPGALTALRSLFGFGADTQTIPLTTPSRRQQAANQRAVIALVRQAAAIEAARALADITPASFDDAIALRDEVSGQLVTEAETADDATYTALTDLRVAVIQDVAARTADLSRLVRHPVGQTQPALVLAYRLYGRTDQADAIVARNKIRHPGFVPGGRTLEVLTA